ncbi:MAG: phosphoribosyltransferase [Verrucomicrobiaceae bacterium]|nr:MAG: phosphoribosyltransferase [Verrucomicrobiaceae bacterium]
MNASATRGFANREQAGRILAEKLAPLAVGRNPVLLALPRGGVPVAAVVAGRLGVPMDVLIVRKLGVPGHEEFAMGAIAGGGVMVLDHRVVAQLGLDLADVERVIQRETRELARREELYRENRPPPAVAGRTVIVVDDGVATGSTMSAAIELLRHQKAARIIVAVPVAPPDTARRLRGEADEVVTLLEPADFMAVGRWYEDFSQTSDEDVRRLLAGQG